MKYIFSLFCLAVLAISSATPSQAGEQVIGEPKHINGMNIAAVYLQPVKMYPAVENHGDADIHIEADISAAKDNKHGFEEGAWIPYLTISYTIKKTGSDWQQSGSFMPMVANDGPHYGKNIKLDGAGEYVVSYHIDPPVMNGFFRHTDKETGVAKWWHGFDISWSFKYIGIGKKGAY